MSAAKVDRSYTSSIMRREQTADMMEKKEKGSNANLSSQIKLKESKGINSMR